jgi:hypothetical protein
LILAEAGKLCSREITVYLVGGGAMAIRREKDATKDVDLILEFEEDAEELGNALKRLGFEINVQPPMECRSLIDAKIMTALIGMRVDIFVQTVCHKLILSQGIKTRSEYFGDLNGISLYVCSREDLFLLKSVTERNRDLDDMIVLYRKGIDKEILLTECRSQSRHDDPIEGRIWEAFLLTKVQEMEERFGVSIPWKSEVERIASSKLGSRLVLEQISKGVTTVPEISANLELVSVQVRKYLSYLETLGTVEIDRKVKPNKIVIKVRA